MSERIPVCDANGTIVERVDPSRAICISQAKNADVIRKRRGEIVRINLRSMGDDSLEPGLRAHPFRYSHNRETVDNVENVWTLRHIPTECGDIFGAVVNELAKAA